MFPSIFEGELGDAGFVEFAEVFADHAVVLFLGRACERQVETKLPRERTPEIVGDFIARQSRISVSFNRTALRARTNL
jgi:hypothetical protein